MKTNVRTMTAVAVIAAASLSLGQTAGGPPPVGGGGIGGTGGTGGTGGGTTNPGTDSNPTNPANWRVDVVTLEGNDRFSRQEWNTTAQAYQGHSYVRSWLDHIWYRDGVPQGNIDYAIPITSVNGLVPTVRRSR